MRTLTKQIQVYKFDELEKPIQEKIIERTRNQEYECLDLEFWCDDVKERLEQMGFKDIELHYSLGYCQGDGFCFEGKLDLKKYLNQDICMWLKYRKLLNIFCYCGIKKTGHNYCHSKTTDVYVEPEIDRYSATNKKEIKQCDEMEALADEFQAYLESLKEELCKKFEKEGYEEIEYRTSEAVIKEYIIDDNLVFDETGERI
jgi:hypothetical protein